MSGATCRARSSPARRTFAPPRASTRSIVSTAECWAGSVGSSRRSVATRSACATRGSDSILRPPCTRSRQAPNGSAAGLTTSLRALRLARVDSDFHTPVLAAAGLGFVRCDRLGLAEAARRHTSPIDALRYQKRPGRLGTTLRQGEVVGVRADAVRVPRDEELRPRVLVEARREVAEVRRRLGPNDVRVEVEQQPGRERHLDPFADALHDGAGNVLLELRGLLVHLVADDHPGRAANDRAEDRA